MIIRAALDILSEHQYEISAHMMAAVARLDGDPEAARVPLAHARWQLVRLLGRYHLFKHVEIFEPAIAHGGRQHVDHARALLASCNAAQNDVRKYVLYWSGEDVVARWPDYSPAMRALVNQIYGFLEIERGHIETLIAGSERTRLLVR